MCLSLVRWMGLVCVPGEFLHAALKARCCFVPQSHNCSGTAGQEVEFPHCTTNIYKQTHYHLLPRVKWEQVYRLQSGAVHGKSQYNVGLCVRNGSPHANLFNAKHFLCYANFKPKEVHNTWTNTHSTYRLEQDHIYTGVWFLFNVAEEIIRYNKLSV